MVTLKGEKLSLYGKPLEVGSYTPRLYLTDRKFNSGGVGGASGKKQLVSVIPSIDGGVCQTQTRTFYQKAAQLAGVDILCVAVDLPFALDRFCATDGIESITMLSDYKDKLFGKVYGLLLTSGLFEGMLARAVLVIDSAGKLIYQEICPEIANEPDYEAALRVLQA